ncbi:hypothetical protein FisN_12Hh185 [Fistulifera solaris]|uniref:SAM-dependent MTase RsmB/NOP-type domain-containing protein n=1 Tax=Fistulifera solaris TaxID=1519565 RepID=A0A1Z5KBE7_FISSO|nr:hypothetical protein FisN_12Hh185 [Fistulifera solaris]|eukprot:GAX23613.1 hypothetical protein FisN_12Hh185 [Fistulifera solaris]
MKDQNAENTSSFVLYSLDQFQVSISDEVKEHLTRPLQNLYAIHEEAVEHFQRMMDAMKRPPLQSVCRVNLIQSSRDQVMEGIRESLQKWIVSRGGDPEQMKVRVRPHPQLHDTIVVDVIPKDTSATLGKLIMPPNHTDMTLFPHWPTREQLGWPMSHRAILCDRLCGEAVLRGSDIFVRGILMADAGIVTGEVVAVYAHLGDVRKIARGRKMEEYRGECLFLGLGTACCSRVDMFRLESGLGVTMSPFPWDRAGPSMPPLSGILPHVMMPQNLPSIVVTHALQPEQNDTILDMCSAPGGKSLHLASWTKDQATIVACDRSRSKMIAADETFRQAGATCITPLALDTTSCVLQLSQDVERKTVQQILSSAKPSTKDSLLHVKGFYPGSFDRILTWSLTQSISDDLSNKL